MPIRHPGLAYVAPRELGGPAWVELHVQTSEDKSTGLAAPPEPALAQLLRRGGCLTSLCNPRRRSGW
jgi:hypothetical protein